MDTILWHYTSYHALEGILYCNEIRTSFNGGDVRQTVWFSSHQIWEPSAFNRTGTPNVRIGVLSEVAPHNRLAFLQLSGVDTSYADGLESRERNPDIDSSRWFVAFENVSRSKWVVVERLNEKTGEWEDLRIPPE